MKIIKGRAVTFTALAVVLILFVSLIIVIASSVEQDDIYDAYEVTIDGQYSIDGGEWQDTIPGEMLHSNFHTVTIRGHLSKPMFLADSCLVVISNNMWYTLKTDCFPEYSIYRDEDTSPRKNSPGSTITYFDGRSLFSDPTAVAEEITLTLTFPYELFSDADLSDFIKMYVSDVTGIYENMLDHKLPQILFSLAICFFGLFAFPIAGSVIGGFNIRYWAFSLLCFFTGIYLLSNALYSYMPLWIDDPPLCMSICESTAHIFGICVLIFIKVLLNKPIHKIIGNIALLSFSALIIVLLIFNAKGVRDLYSSSTVAQIFFFVCAVVLTICLFRERKANHNAKLAIFTLIPIATTLIFDSLNTYLGFSDISLFEAGVALTLFLQILNLIYDLRRQYLENLRFQQMQKELYEAEVAVMVSQIQPHFMYNALSSIAMLCKIDPDTAYEATIAFSEYLRGNMDSLKQKEPVPFEKELEHLKKYLYIEQLRFGKKLNIVYDIEATDFVLPQLTIQPLVENAVKHGVGMKKKGGTVTIATRETDNAYEVVITDDGVGFDTSAPKKDDGRSHVGMENTRKRLKEMCGADVIIESVVSEGTTARVILPKEGQNHENTVR